MNRFIRFFVMIEMISFYTMYVYCLEQPESDFTALLLLEIFGRWRMHIPSTKISSFSSVGGWCVVSVGSVSTE